MLHHLLRRSGEGVVAWLVVSALVFWLVGLMPGDPLDLLISADPDITPADVERLKALYGLDQPLWSRYLAWLGGAVTGELGFSRLYAQPVAAILLDPLLNTLVLMLASLVLGLAIAVPLAVLAARRPGGPLDLSVNLLAFTGF